MIHQFLFQCTRTSPHTVAVWGPSVNTRTLNATHIVLNLSMIVVPVFQKCVSMQVVMKYDIKRLPYPQLWISKDCTPLQTWSETRSLLWLLPCLFLPANSSTPASCAIFLRLAVLQPPPLLHPSVPPTVFSSYISFLAVPFHPSSSPNASLSTITTSIHHYVIPLSHCVFLSDHTAT